MKFEKVMAMGAILVLLGLPAAAVTVSTNQSVHADGLGADLTQDVTINGNTVVASVMNTVNDVKQVLQQVRATVDVFTQLVFSSDQQRQEINDVANVPGNETVDNETAQNDTVQNESATQNQSENAIDRFHRKQQQIAQEHEAYKDQILVRNPETMQDTVNTSDSETNETEAVNVSANESANQTVDVDNRSANTTANETDDAVTPPQRTLYEEVASTLEQWFGGSNRTAANASAAQNGSVHAMSVVA